eukprot:TRINITY_DN9164_c0_g1_i1.p1 TRINITY_DN9164_c0_g1~~TRINITY_DN9164_c0_g1_i1.p1  ORF type:complete len:327 (-),score=95.94 TRINITY_DN9164_c0_g1_i1:51-986(-)
MEMDTDATSIFTVTGGRGARGGRGGRGRRGGRGGGEGARKRGRQEMTEPKGQQEEEVQIDLDAYRRGEVELGEKIITVDFDVRVFEELDFKSLARYLIKYCQKQWFNSSEMADIILAQDYLGSAIKEEGEVEMFGFISCVPFRAHVEKECMQQIRKFVLTKAPSHSVSVWENLLDTTSLGLLLNYRLLNVPHDLAPELHVTIYEEIEWAVEDGKPFQFTDFLYITRYGHQDAGAKGGEQGEVKRGKGGRGGVVENKDWFMAEDAIYYKHATNSFTTPITHSETRVIMHFKAEKVPAILAEIRSYITENFVW